MNREILTPPHKLIGFWEHRWVRSDELQDQKLPHMTDERFQQMMNQAYEAGWSRGELQGRANLRACIENGTIEPIQLQPQPD